LGWFRREEAVGGRKKGADTNARPWKTNYFFFFAAAFFGAAFFAAFFFVAIVVILPVHHYETKLEKLHHKS
jgi:hypothetical protein